MVTKRERFEGGDWMGWHGMVGHIDCCFEST